MKKGLAVRNQKREKAGKAESEETREEVQGGLVFLFFIFCLRDCRERIV